MAGVRPGGRAFRFKPKKKGAGATKVAPMKVARPKASGGGNPATKPAPGAGGGGTSIGPGFRPPVVNDAGLAVGGVRPPVAGGGGGLNPKPTPPGIAKKAAGLQSARSLAPGRQQASVGKIRPPSSGGGGRGRRY